MAWTGGCLCGAIRYRANEEPKWASYCHCGMCRKVSGAPFTAFVEFEPSTVTWMRGEPIQYSSSAGVIRRFCGKCGSALTFEADGVLFLTLGSLDSPESVKFNCHTYTASRLPGMELRDGLPNFSGPVGGKGGRLTD